ncbi:phosphodiester glycosidase family protein [Luteolibacter flavescens]|uniref:Phosphodiester glycosidase family protein n=1 Tax=Luteolibacter flavescens TaxID=1859460 RepID=A0ABT3FI93_9BACT|nr:phosphodiester glycosidase family protein [Luteolibacter flavescens]MCW1883283.1 phosphodiester glycosidase family protein [Luteolibacter flavescens]
MAFSSLRPLALLFLLLGPASGEEGAVGFVALAGSSPPEWKPLFQGVEYRLSELEKPRRIRIHEVRIDTKAEGISFFTTPDNGDVPQEVDGRRTTTFLKEFDLEIAINGTGFKPIAKEGAPVDVLGLSVSDGRKVSALDAKSRNPVFLATADQKVQIVRAPFPEEGFPQAHNALQGWYGANGMLVDDGEVVTATVDIHPRTAVGVSKDGRHAYFVVADGRQPGRSEGMTLIELAEWMKASGCWDAANLDGGGSSTMVTKDEKGAAKILNSPSGGIQRSVGNHLGVHALPLAR